jgi:hypothetical protein
MISRRLSVVSLWSEINQYQRAFYTNVSATSTWRFSYISEETKTYFGKYKIIYKRVLREAKRRANDNKDPSSHTVPCISSLYFPETLHVSAVISHHQAYAIQS